MSDTPRPPRRLFAIAVAAAVVGFILTLSFGFADQAPHRTACWSPWRHRQASCEG